MAKRASLSEQVSEIQQEGNYNRFKKQHRQRDFSLALSLLSHLILTLPWSTSSIPMTQTGKLRLREVGGLEKIYLMGRGPQLWVSPGSPDLFFPKLTFRSLCLWPNHSLFCSACAQLSPHPHGDGPPSSTARRVLAGPGDHPTLHPPRAS